MRRLAVILAASAALAAGACSTLGKAAFKQPVVNLKDVRVRGLGLTGGSLDVLLSVYNPNHFNLNASRLTYKLMVENTELGTGALANAFHVGSGDSTLVAIPVDFTYAGLGSAGRRLLDNGTVNYRVIGDFTVDTPLGSFTRPYDQRGRFSSFSSTKSR